MSSSGPTIAQAEVVGMVLPITATVVTSFRLFVRTQQRRLWLDDAWAALAMLFDIGSLVVFWLYLHDYARYPQSSRVALYYMCIPLTNQHPPSMLKNIYRNTQFFYALVWLSRISILFTVIRLTFPGPLRRWLICTAIAFMVTWMVLGAQIFWTCEAEPSWKSQPRPQCDLGRNVAITLIITDVIGDSILILAPFRLIYKIKLTAAQKIRLLSIFSTSAITTAVSLIHTFYVYSDGGLKEAITAIIESSTSLIVANLSVVVAFLFRISTEDSSTPAPLEFKSIITFGSQPIRTREQHDPPSPSTVVVGIETSTIRLVDFSISSIQAARGDGSDAEAASIETLDKPGLFYEA
ncbi:hypothetical protein BKA82DRAFT_1002514 [Pisolithus tinctorius]|uniref:Rhodopsin domain-containing protein n=1 Tax=Pisolithus tinctorius Marx 270 TaxID=870435 RepID=A0A0C3IZ53_PISTI|nr:hypothetical protein BKA82DRAFT_1002514 [Pisolithus tinctorius]KIO02078.1 hypothetical protein M404DRAFT_1002514 [Pisolithus tinctorius Marx 270]